MPIEVESPEQLGYDTITNNLSESSVADRRLGDLGLSLDLYGHPLIAHARSMPALGSGPCRTLLRSSICTDTR